MQKNFFNKITIISLSLISLSLYGSEINDKQIIPFKNSIPNMRDNETIDLNLDTNIVQTVQNTFNTITNRNIKVVQTHTTQSQQTFNT
ncbi:MAG TPA: hypothetical protein VL201_00390, partial [Patescibacteria group bacterium]|nr:hypothetical protein [Patescibacteria group bacterium]